MRCAIEMGGSRDCRRQRSVSKLCPERKSIANILKFGVSVLLVLGLASCGNITSSARYGDIDGIARSLNDGVSIETRSPNGATPLIVAAYSGQPEAVRFLIEKGADINATDKNHCSALIHAAYYNIEDVAKILVEYDADRGIKDRYGHTAYDYAVKFGHMGIAALLEMGIRQKPAAATSPAVIEPVRPARHLKLCIFPWKLATVYFSTSEASTRKAVSAVIEKLDSEKAVDLTHCYYRSDIPKAYQDRFKDTEELLGVGENQVWNRKGAFLPPEPDRTFIVQKGKEIGADLGLLIRTEKSGEGMVNVFVYLVDINKNIITKSEYSVYYISTYDAMQDGVRKELEKFLSANQ